MLALKNAKQEIMDRIFTINGGSSSIKFALFEADGALRRILAGRIEGIGQRQSSFMVKGQNGADDFSRPLTARDHTAAAKVLMNWIHEKIEQGGLAGIGHRLVHGGRKYWEPQRITREMISALCELRPFDPEHLAGEILLIEAFHRRFSELPQIACFDTAFHHNMPRVAQLIPIPRRYEAKGVRRYGFHGISCAYIIEELARLAGSDAANGRLIIAHLGNGASLTAVRGGKSIDTSMAFTPAAGIPMSTRSGDLDPGLSWYLARTEGMTAEQFNYMVNQESGLLGVSETSSDMHELLSREKNDVRAAEAMSLFCYQAKKWIGALVAALGGLDTLIFSGGIGENSPPIRSRICAGIKFLGVELDRDKNAASAPVISKSSISVRVIPTDEELMIARAVSQVLRL